MDRLEEFSATLVWCVTEMMQLFTIAEWREKFDFSEATVAIRLIAELVHDNWFVR